MIPSVLCILCSNFAVLVFKLIAYFHTGSAAMLSEAVHSLVDMLNQVPQFITAYSVAAYQEWSLALTGACFLGQMYYHDG